MDNVVEKLERQTQIEMGTGNRCSNENYKLRMTKRNVEWNMKIGNGNLYHHRNEF